MSKTKFEMRLLNDTRRNKPLISIEDMMFHINEWMKLYGDKSYIEFLSKTTIESDVVDLRDVVGKINSVTYNPVENQIIFTVTRMSDTYESDFVDKVIGYKELYNSETQKLDGIVKFFIMDKNGN